MRFRIGIFFGVILGAVLTNTAASAQALQSCWDRTFQVGEADYPQAFMQSVNGWIIVVGETERPGQKKDGFFLALDAGTGQVLFREVYGGSKDDGLLAVAQAPDGTFYLAGYTESGSQGRSDGWLLRVDEEGKMLGETRLGWKGAERFTHLTVLDQNKVLLAGQPDKKSKGNVLLVLAEQMRRKDQNTQFGNGRLGELVGLWQAPSGDVWLWGNTYRRVIDEEGTVWGMKIDPETFTQRSRRIRLDAYEGGRLNSVRPSLFGDMMLAGSRLRSRQSDAWVMEYSAKGTELIDISYGDRREEKGVAALRTPQEKLLLARQVSFTGAGSTMESEVVIIDRYGEERTYTIPQKEGFFIKDMLYHYRGNILVMGIARKAGEPRLRMSCLDTEELLALAKNGKSGVVECTKPQLRDGNRDGVLGPDERGTITFELINVGQEHIMEGNIQVKGLRQGSHFERSFFGFLPKGARKKVDIPIVGQDIMGDITQLDIEVREKEQVLATFPFKVKRRVAAGQSGSLPALEVITEWETPYSNSRRNNNQAVRVSDDKVQITYDAYSPDRMQKTDFKIRRNGVLLDDKKQENIKFEQIEADRSGYPFTQTLQFEIALEDGDNQIVVEIQEDGRTVQLDTIRFTHRPRTPNLHVVVVGPAGVDLKYNVDDALDFAGLMKAQQHVFGEVYIDTLVTREETTTQNIRMSFARLQKRYLSNTTARPIETNDVLVVFVSSHGLLVEEDGMSQFKIMPSDYDPDFKSLTTVDYEREILKPLKYVDCKKLIFIDACHSGAAGAKNERVGLNKYILELNETTPGLLAVTSSGREESSFENAKWQNGAFTKAIEEAFHGAPVQSANGAILQPNLEETEEGYRIIRMDKLYDFLLARVPDLVGTLGKDYKQNPLKETDNPELESIPFLIVSPQGD